MRGATGRAEPQSQDAPGRDAQTTACRLAVHEKAAAVGGLVRPPRAVAAAFFAHDEQQADARLPEAPQRVDGGNLRREDTLGVNRAAAVEATDLEAAGKE